MAYYKKYQRKGSGVKRGNVNYTTYKRVQYKKGIKQARNKMGAYGKPPTLQKVISLIQRAVNKNVENKTSNLVEHSGNVCKYPHSGTYTNFFKSFNGIFDTITQGVNAASRIGNRFKLKGLYVDIMIHPDETYLKNYTTDTRTEQWMDHPKALENTYQGILTFYIGKRIDGGSIDDKVVDLLQKGNTAADPSGKLYDQLYPDNKDVYKIYFKRRMKCGMSSVPDMNTSYVVHETTAHSSGGILITPEQKPVSKFQNIPMMPNNDYKLTHKFKVNICNFIGKNATIRYNDDETSAVVPSTLHGLTMWATWSPCVGNVVMAPVGAGTTQDNAFFKIHTSTYFDFEDA